MLIDKQIMEAMIIFLYKTGEDRACMELIKVYHKYFKQELVGLPA